MRIRALILVLFGVLGVALAQAPTESMTIAVETSPSTFDCWFTNESLCLYLSKLWGDTLVNIDPNDPSKLLPGLATSWKFTDSTTLQMTLRKGVKFQNGEPFNAGAVKATLEYMADPANGSRLNYAVNWLSKVKVVDDYTVDLIYKAPNPPGLQRLAQLGTIYPPKYYFQAGSEDFGKKPIGTGPYKLVRWVRDQEADFEANPDYFGGTKGMPKLKKLAVRFIPEQSTRIAELLAGRVDLITDVSPDQVALIKAQQDIVTALPTNALVYLTMDAMGRSGETPLRNQKVRQAVAESIDKKAIVDNVLSGYASPASELATPYMFGYAEGIPSYDYNPEHARTLLAQAGYPNGFTVNYVSWIPQRQALEAIVGYLADVGITAKLNYYGADVATANQIIASGKAAMHTSLWTTIFDADAILSPHFAKGSARAYADDPDLQAWLQEAASTNDSTRRAQLYREALTRINQQAYVIPLFSPKLVVATKPNVDLSNFVSPEAPLFYGLGWKH